MNLSAVQSALGYTFVDPALLVQALTHRSWSTENGNAPHLERLELLGDAVLGLLVTHRLLADHPSAPEGEISAIKARLVGGEANAMRARSLGLGEQVRLGAGEQTQGGREKDAVLRDAFEAVLGAVYLDGGLEAAGAVLDRLPSPPEDEDHTRFGKDPKSALQEHCQAEGWALPVYRPISESGPAHQKAFVVEVVVATGSALGHGTSKKEAQRQAARAMLEALLGGPDHLDEE